MTPRQALAFVRRHGVVLESARGPVPSLAEAIAGGPIRGSWWGHPSGQLIFAVTRAVRDSEHVLVCRLVEGKVTFVHERVWPALVRLAPRFPKTSLARITEVHTASGRHAMRSTAFPRWVPPAVQAAGSSLGEARALRILGHLVPQEPGV
ncbi:MAG: hypothetical protein ACREAA_02595 [Candidatus Polarisedimenticolia bacterium]